MTSIQTSIEEHFDTDNFQLKDIIRYRRQLEENDDIFTKEKILNLSGKELENLIIQLNQSNGFECYQTQDGGGDGGVDIIAIKENVCKLIEVKNRKEPTGGKHRSEQALDFKSNDVQSLNTNLPQGINIPDEHQSADVLEIYSTSGFSESVYKNINSNTSAEFKLYNGEEIAYLLNSKNITPE